MRQIGKKELSNYIEKRIKEDETNDIIKTVLFEDLYPGFLSICEENKLMIINLKRFLSFIKGVGYNTNVANLIVLSATEHELVHALQFRELLDSDIDDERTYLLRKSLILNKVNPAITKGEEYYSLLHEYDADIRSTHTLLKSREFIDRATYDSIEDLYAFNRYAVDRLLIRYSIEDKSYPLKSFFKLARNYDLIPIGDIPSLASYIATRELNEIDNILNGKSIKLQTHNYLSLVLNGQIKSKNILSLK